MIALASMRSDLAALGLQAPLRAWYELGKRTGLHGITLRSVARLARPVDLEVLKVFRPELPLPDAVAKRCLIDAALIVQEGHRAFGTRTGIHCAGDWNLVATNDVAWPQDSFWWQIDIRGQDRLGDVKWTWEIGRHRDLVVLARAAYLDPGGPWADALGERLRWWFQATPPEHGVHWYSNLEISLRIIAWVQIFALASDVLPPDVLASMSHHVALSRNHLLVDFPYTASSMRNNHLLGDALGLIVIEQFSGRETSSMLGRIAVKTFQKQLSRHMRRDGSMIEDSLSYHRFVMEMLIVRFLLGGERAGITSSLAASAAHLERLGALRGSLPQYGDWDEGRILASSSNVLEVGGSTALALSLTGPDPLNPGFAESDEVAWYSAGRSRNKPSAETSIDSRSPDSIISGGIQHAVMGDWSVWLKTGTGPSHQHADLFHVCARLGDSWVLVDPGTGSYNGDVRIRNLFRTSRSHNGLRSAGEEMFVPHRAFRWLSGANVLAGPIIESDTSVVLWGLHDAFCRTKRGGRHVRAVVVTRQGMTCVDWRENDEIADLTVALPPRATVSGSEMTLPTTEEVLRMSGFEDSTQIHGSRNPFAAQHSTTYGQWEPSTWLNTTISKPGASTWSVGTLDTATPCATVEGAEVEVAKIKLTIAFTSQGASLTVEKDGLGSSYEISRGDA